MVAGRTVAEDEAMNASEFRDDDAGYLTWLDTHPMATCSTSGAIAERSKRVCTSPVAGLLMFRFDAAPPSNSKPS